MDRGIFERLAAMYRYPEEGALELAAGLQQELERVSPGAAARLRPFTAWALENGLEAFQEHFIRAFDMNPSGCLEVGWHLFGENYERGELLVELRSLLRELGIVETMELPDHLCHVLAVLARDEEGDAAPLARRFVAPAIEKMMLGHAQDPQALALLEGTLALVIAEFGAAIAFEPPNRHLPVLRAGGQADV